MLRIENMSHKWAGFSLSEVSLEVKEGEYFVILGPTGAGKTLLLESVAGFYPTDFGTISFNNQTLSQLPPRKRNIGFVYQDHALFPHLDVANNVEYGMKMQGVDRDERRVRRDELLDKLDISNLSQRKVSTLSGGEAQRVSLARALVTKPKVLLLDEPLSALDPHLKMRLVKELKHIHREMKTTTIHVTHDREEAMMLADKIGVMHDGKLMQIGTPQQVFRSPQSRFVAEFVGVENIFEGMAKKKENGLTEFEFDGIVIESMIEWDGEATASIRPEEVVISLRNYESSARNRLEGKVLSMDDMGRLVRVEIDCGPVFCAMVTKRSADEMELSEETEVTLTFKAQSVNIF